jgi:hypothetical protein
MAAITSPRDLLWWCGLPQVTNLRLDAATEQLAN